MFERILDPNTNDMFRVLFSVRNRYRVHNAIVYSYDIKALTGEIILNNCQPNLRFRHSYFNRNLFISNVYSSPHTFRRLFLF
jgi:hypothetical protein